MKNCLNKLLPWLLPALCLQAKPLMAQLYEGRKVESAILGKSVAYSIYLPEGWQATGRRYPVLYLLHGYTDDETAWVQFGQAKEQLDRAIADGGLPPVIVVMPDGGVSFYVNDYQGKTRYEDFFLNELLPHIEAQYPSRSGREFRVLAGLSMGGYGSLQLAMRHPELFGGCAALSAAVYSETAFAALPDAHYNPRYAALFGPRKGAGRITAHWKSYDPISLVNDLPADELRRVRYWIDCGDDDFLSEGNARLHIALKNKGIQHEFRMRQGGHEWQYWREGLVPALKFLAEGFVR